jgi:hypothetical protein
VPSLFRSRWSRRWVCSPWWGEGTPAGHRRRTILAGGGAASSPGAGVQTRPGWGAGRRRGGPSGPPSAYSPRAARKGRSRLGSLPATPPRSTKHREVQPTNPHTAEVPASVRAERPQSSAAWRWSGAMSRPLSLHDVIGCRCDLSVTYRRGLRGLTERATLVVAEHPAFARTFAAPDRYSFRQPWLWG